MAACPLLGAAAGGAEAQDRESSRETRTCSESSGGKLQGGTSAVKGYLSTCRAQGLNSKL